MDDNKISTKNFLYTINDWDTFQKVKSLLGKQIKTSRCIIIIGEIFSGKTTIAKYIEYKYNYKRYLFAEPLKKMVNKIFNLSDDDKKNNNIYKCNNIGILLDKLDNELEHNKLKKLSVFEKEYIKNICCNDNGRSFVYRKLLQYIGTEIFRKRDENFWVFKTINILMKEPNNVVIDDCRFINEYKALRDLYYNNLYVIKVVRPTKEYLPSNIKLHPSETEISRIDYDKVIINDKSLLTLYKEVDKIIDEAKG